MAALANCRLKLYFDDVSPQSRSCLILVKYLVLEVELHYVDLSHGNQLSEEYGNVNCAHTVPTLVSGNFVLTDSNVIMMYLCDICRDERNHNLYPFSFTQRFQIINKLFFGSSHLGRRHNELMSEIVRKKFANFDYDYHLKRISDAYNTLEQFLLFSCNFVGNDVTIVDISYYATLSGLNVIFPITYARWPRLNRWFQSMCASPFGSFNEPGINKQTRILKNFGQFTPGIDIGCSLNLLPPSTLRSVSVVANPLEIDGNRQIAQNPANNHKSTNTEFVDLADLPLKILNSIIASRQPTSKDPLQLHTYSHEFDNPNYSRKIDEATITDFWDHSELILNGFNNIQKFDDLTIESSARDEAIMTDFRRSFPRKYPSDKRKKKLPLTPGGNTSTDAATETDDMKSLLGNSHSQGLQGLDPSTEISSDQDNGQAGHGNRQDFASGKSE